MRALAGSLGLKSEIEPEAARALARGLELAAEAKAWLIVTGSLYLIGALRPAIVAEAVVQRQVGPSLDLQQS